MRLPTLALRLLAHLYILPFKDIALALKMSLALRAAESLNLLLLCGAFALCLAVGMVMPLGRAAGVPMTPCATT